MYGFIIYWKYPDEQRTYYSRVFGRDADHALRKFSQGRNETIVSIRAA